MTSLPPALPWRTIAVWALTALNAVAAALIALLLAILSDTRSKVDNLNERMTDRPTRAEVREVIADRLHLAGLTWPDDQATVNVPDTPMELQK